MLSLLALLAQAPIATTVGRITVLTWPEQATLGVALAERADRSPPFPGIGALPERPIRLILASTRERFDSLTRGRLPAWSEGAAFPESGTIVLLTDAPPDRLRGALRHELAHLALRWDVRRRLPLWFEEGYAAVAAGEWGRLDALRLNWHVARGIRMNLDDVDRALRAGAAEADAAYALATTAVLLLERWGGERGLAPLMATLGSAPTFDAALRATYYVTEGDFEARWERDVAAHYGWLAWVEAAGLFWTVVGCALVWVWARRRRRERARRTALDDPRPVLDDAPTP
jgi:hypothetical protein